MIKILEDIYNYQEQLIMYKSNIDDIYNKCRSNNVNAYELLELYGITKRYYAIYYSLLLSLEERVNQYLKRTEVQSFLAKTAESSFCGEAPKMFVNNDEVITINDNPYLIYNLLTIMDEKLIDFDNYTQIIDQDLIKITSNNVIEICNSCLKIIAKKTEEMENTDISNYEDDNFNYNFANYALLKAFKNLNVHECDHLPSEIRIEIIKILQKGLNAFDTNDIYKLYQMAEQKLYDITNETKIIEDNNQKRKLIK